jgi:hypothetical protein
MSSQESLVDSSTAVKRELPLDRHSEELVPDLGQARLFLNFLAGNDPVSFQTFDDNEQRRKLHKQEKGSDPYARVFHGTLDQHAKQLIRLNNEGAGIYVMVNKGDQKGRKNTNVVSVRAFFVDLDGSPLEPVKEAPVKPHVIVQSSPGHFHAYWKVSDCPPEKFRRVQKALAEKFNGDPAVCDLARVMRLPGFYHRKAKPFMTVMEAK